MADVSSFSKILNSLRLPPAPVHVRAHTVITGEGGPRRPQAGVEFQPRSWGHFTSLRSRPLACRKGEGLSRVVGKIHGDHEITRQALNESCPLFLFSSSES